MLFHPKRWPLSCNQGSLCNYLCFSSSFFWGESLFFFLLFRISKEFPCLFIMLYIHWRVSSSKFPFGLIFRSCVNNCISNGCIGEKCFPHCNITLNGDSLHSPWYMQEALYLKWKQSDCLGDCRYYCMIDREQKRQSLGHGPVKYHGKWPFKRVFGLQVCHIVNVWLLLLSIVQSSHQHHQQKYWLETCIHSYVSGLPTACSLYMQEPVSVALSIFNLLMHLRGWLSFYLLLRYKLPQKQNKTYYEYTTLWHIYGLLSINSWVWSAVFHSR